MFKNKEGQVRSGWKIAAVSAVMFLSLIIFSSIVFVIFLPYMKSKGYLDPSTMKYTSSGNEFISKMNTVLMFFNELIMIVVPIVAWKFIFKKSLTKMGLSPLKKHWLDLITGLLFGIVSMSAVFLLILFSGNAEVKSWVPVFSKDTIIYLILFILVGFAEEIYGRGFIMSTLKQTKKLPLIIILSSIIFSLLHSSNSGIGIIPYINLFLVGALFAYIYIKSGSIWMSIGYHITWNYFQGNVYGFKVSGMNTQGIISTVYDKNNIFNGGKFGPEGGLFVTAVILAGFLFVKLYYKNKPYDFLEDTDTQVIESKDMSEEELNSL